MTDPHLVGDGAFILVDFLTLGLLDGNTLRVLDLTADGVVNCLALRLGKRGLRRTEITGPQPGEVKPLTND